MMKNLPLIACLWLISSLAMADCTPASPEIGEIGPSSELVCRELQRRFPASMTAVESRTILSPTQVAIKVSVNGQTTVLRYELAHFAWKLTTPEDALAATSLETPHN